MKRPELLKSEDIFNRVMVRDNIAILTLLQQIDTGAYFLAANTHLHWDPLFADVKLIQTALLLEEVEKSLLNWNRTYNLIETPNGDLTAIIKTVSVVICGDFNSTANSGVVEFLSSGHVPADHADILPYDYHPLSEGGLSHKFELQNAYQRMPPLEFTDFTPSFKDVIDYVWHSSPTLQVTGLLSGVDKEYTSKCVGFPNAHHPSDHIPLVVSLRRKQTLSQTGRKVNFK